MMRIANVLFCIIMLVSPGASAEPDNHLRAGRLNREGLAQLEKGNFGPALKLFSRAAGLDPGKKYLYNNMAVAYIKMERYSEAEKKLRICLAMDGKYVRAMSNLAVVLFYQRRYSEAYRYYRMSKESDPGYTAGRFSRGRVIKKLRLMKKDSPADGEIQKILDHLESGKSRSDFP